jgi:hypothetical protein
MKDIAIVKAREKVGSATYNKFKFQIAVAIELLLELARENKDFWLLMDYLEDVVVIENYNEEVSIISFYQVKSKEKNAITIGNVISEKFLDKMHYNISAFRDHDCNAFLITNCGINFNGNTVSDTAKVNLKEYLDKIITTGDTKKDLNENEFRLKKKKEIIKSISKSEKIKEEDVDLSKFFLLTTTLTLNDYDRQISGSFVDFMGETHPGLTGESIHTIKEKIWNDLDKKNKFVIGDNAVDESYILRNKGITRKGFDEIVSAQKLLQFPTYTDLANFSIKYGSHFGNSPLKDKERYIDFQTECTLEERKTLTLVFGILKDLEKEYIDSKKDELLRSIDFFIEQDCRVASLELYGKYKDLIQILYLFKRLED